MTTLVNAKDGLTYVWIPPGHFTMGCSPGDTECFDDEKRTHAVIISHGFWMGQTEVTQEAYQRVTGENPSHFKGAGLPVETVSWEEAQAYCQAIAARLPTEAEWEFAARGGNPAGRYGPLADVAWQRDDSNDKTHAVAQKKPNGFGLYDMLGNLWQWTADWYSIYDPAPANDPAGPTAGIGRTLRGGSWSDFERFLRASDREASAPHDRYDVIGFRCVTAPEFIAADQSVPASGGKKSLALAFPASVSWTASSSGDWITFTGAASGTGSGTLTYQVAPNPGPARTAIVTVASTSFRVEQQAASINGLGFIGSLPQFIAQENWGTTFTFVNKDKAPAQARLSLFGLSGDPLDLPLVFPQLPPVPGPLEGASLDRTLAPGASLIIDTAGPKTAPAQIGSAQLAATGSPSSGPPGSIDGFAILHLLPAGQEAALPIETRNAGSYLLAFYNTGGASLGVAVENLSPEAANVPLVIRDGTGAQIATGSLALPGNGRTSFGLDAQYPVTANARGTIELHTPPGGRISALGIRTATVKDVTTLTAIPALAAVGTGGGVIPHLATGNGWQTTFVLINTGQSAAQASLRFFNDKGDPMPLPAEFPQSADNPAPAASSSITRNLAAGAMLIVRSAGPVADPAPTIGSAQLSTDGNVGGFAILRYDPSGQEAVVPLEARDAGAYLLLFDNTNGTSTGVAVSSAASEAVTIPVVLRDDAGNELGSGSIELAANGHSTFILATRFPATAGIRGSVEFTAPPGSRLGVVGIRTPGSHTFTTLPALAK